MDQDWPAWIAGLNDSGALIVAEGPKDEAALRCIGVTAPIELLHGRALFQVVEAVSGRQRPAILLLDLDKKGKQLYGRLKKGLAAHGVQVDTAFREFLQRQRISHIEGLDTYLTNHGQRPNL